MRRTNTNEFKAAMKSTNTNEFKSKLQAYLEPIIAQKAEDYGQTIEGNPYQWAIDTAKAEVGHEFDRNGDQEGLSYWLSGLAIDIDYNYCDIIRVAESMHDCKLSDKEADMVCERWFDFVACKMLQYAAA